MDGLQRCPHCITVVLPLEDGRCPSCHQNVNDRIPDKKLVTLDNGISLPELPKLCACCGNANSLQPWKMRQSNLNPSRWALAALASVVFFAAAILIKSACWWIIPTAAYMAAIVAIFKNRRAVCIEIPVCTACTPRVDIVLKRTDFEKLEMQLFVHEAFAEEYLGRLDARASR